MPSIRWRMNASAAATVVKKVASFGALALSCAAGKRAIMLDEASIITAMRRPGKRHVLAGQRRVRIGERHDEERHADEEQQQRAVADERGELRAAAPVEHRRQRHLRAAGLGAASATATMSTTAHNPISTTAARIASLRCVNSRSAARELRHSIIVSRMTAGTWVIGTTRGFPARVPAAPAPRSAS